MTLAVLCWMMAGCADEVLDRNGGKGEGRLLLTGIEVESVVGDVITKASLAEDVIPAVSDFTITIVSAATGETVKTLPPGVEAGCFLPVGEYWVKAAYGEEAGMSAIPYFYGESDKVAIVEGEVKSVSLTASLVSAVIHPQMADQLVEQYNFYTLTVSETGGSGATPSQTLINGEDFFVSGGKDKTYNLILAGQNKLGETVTHAWSYSDLVRRTRYIVQCDPDLPAFTLPAQSDGDVWSKFIYITPMTAENMTAHKEMTEKVLANIVYEVSADGQTWIPSESTSSGQLVIKGLDPSKQYTLRSRFGSVYSSNTQSITLENGAQIKNGNMDDWDSFKISSAYGESIGNPVPIYCYYLGTKDSHVWNTSNEESTNGATNSSSDMGLWWRWCSGTIPTSDALESTAAEISTLAFYTDKVNNPASTYLWSRDGVYKNYVYYKSKENYARKVIGTLYTGVDEYGIDHFARPVSLSFSYKYMPCKNGDQCIAYAKIFDAGKNLVAYTNIFKSSGQDVYSTVSLNFEYISKMQKVSYIKVFFQSGSNTSVANMSQSKSDNYAASPYPNDRVVGSVLKIDNVTLNYDYE